MMTGIAGVFAGLTSAAFWALGAVVFKKLGERLEPVGMTTLKALYSGIILVIIALILKETLSIAPQFLLPVALSGILGIALGDSFFFASLNRLSPIVLSALLLAGPDTATGLLAFFMLGENPSAFVWIGIIVTIIGLACLIFPPDKSVSDVKNHFSGFVFAFLSLICTACSSVIIKPVLSQVSALTVTVYRMLFGGAVLLLFALFSGKLNSWFQPFKEKKFVFSFFCVVSLIAVGGFWLSVVAIKYIDLVTASTLMSVEPFFILLFMIFLQKYVPKKRELIGIALSVIGIFVIGLGEIGL